MLKDDSLVLKMFTYFLAELSIKKLLSPAMNKPNWGKKVTKLNKAFLNQRL